MEMKYKCNAALKRFQLEYLDLYFCHRPDKNTPIEETVWVMHNLILQGKILYWGTSEWSAHEIAIAHYAAQKHNLIAPIMEQPQYNMFHRQRVEVEYDFLYRNFGMGTTIWSPLASGVLSGKYEDGKKVEDSRLAIEGLEWLKEKTLTSERLSKVKKLKQIASELGLTLPGMAVAWCLKNPNVSTVILGASRVAQLQENLKAISAVDILNDEAMGKIEDVLQNKPLKPEF